MTKRKKITLLNPSKDKVYIDRYALSLSGYVVLGEAATVKLTAKINSTLDRMFVERIVSNAFPLGAVINGLTDGKSYFLLLGSTEYPMEFEQSICQLQPNKSRTYPGMWRIFVGVYSILRWYYPSRLQRRFQVPPRLNYAGTCHI